jgi:hypothetical protein
MNNLVFIEEWVRGTLRDPFQHFKKRAIRSCPICDYNGFFISAGHRTEARCPNCSSKERDRTFGLYLKNNNLNFKGKNIIHFSPERPFWRIFKSYPNYVSGDIKISKLCNTIIDITDIQFSDEFFDVLICHHVLEHVKQTKVTEDWREFFV